MKKQEVKTIEDPNDIISEIQSPGKISKFTHQNNSPFKTGQGLQKRGVFNSTFNSGFGVAEKNNVSGMNKVMDEARMYDYFFDLVSRGGKKEISKLKECLENDPKSNFYGKNDPKHMINRKNFLG